LYEQCVTAYRMMLPIFQEQEDYEEQMNCHLDLFNLCKLLIDENTMNQRIFSNYYRVAFYGKPFKDMDGKEYIYKELNTNRVAEVAENLKVRSRSESLPQKLNLIFFTEPIRKKVRQSCHVA
jgi:hypothetical protein